MNEKRGMNIILIAVLAVALLAGVKLASAFYAAAEATRLAAKSHYVLASASAGAVWVQSALVVLGALGGFAMLGFFAYSNYRNAQRNAALLDLVRALEAERREAMEAPVDDCLPTVGYVLTRAPRREKHSHTHRQAG